MQHLIDSEPLAQDELLEQCFALAYSIHHSSEVVIKESLSFILLEKLSALFSVMTGEGV